MSYPRTTSRVFAALAAWKTRLQAETWPVGVTGTAPQVTLSSSAEPGQYAELVEILTDVGDDATIDWVSSPHSRLERIPLVVVITVDAGLDEDACLTRLGVLADIVQRSVYDDEAAAPADRMIPLIATPVGADLDGITQVAAAVYPSTAGVRGVATIRYEAVFRI